MNVRFERAAETDAEALVQVQVASFHSDTVLYPGVPLGGPPGYDSVEQMRAKIQHGECYRIVADGQIVGGILVLAQEEGHYHLDLLFIGPDYHNRGIGSRALQFLDQTYPAKRWTLDTPAYSLRNHHFYQKHGFVKIGELTLPDIILFSYEKKVE